jgi:phospholipase/lecithinase/hemolysin
VSLECAFRPLILIFSSGDSYTTTGFNDTLTQPSDDNPLGNPTYPGYTAANGPNWVDYLTTTYNSSLLLTYNLAYGGATVDSALVAPYLPIVLSVAEQVQNEFFPVYGGKSTVEWESRDTLFGVFIGINDVGNSFSRGAANTSILNDLIFDVYTGLIDSLYYAGARNFLFLNVPPTDRSPLITAQGNASVALLKADIADWNARVVNLAEGLKKRDRDTNVFTFDTNALFSEVLDDPASFEATSIYQNTTEYCVAYEK